ncbi:TonB-dependent receptor [Veillonellaceae bacterium M1-70]|nr:TonB-dependent receptor [Veillonellaceae bacterium M1-70]
MDKEEVYLDRQLQNARKKAICCAVLTWLLVPAVYAAGEAPAVTKDVWVKANTAQEEAKNNSQSITVITAADIAKKQAKSVEDIIFDEVGVVRTVDAMGRVGVSIRGAEPRHTLILVDGEPVMGDFAKFYGAADELQRLGTENVARIEIIRGAATAEYGADAIGGVVNIVTKKPMKYAGISYHAEGRRRAGNDELFSDNSMYLRADSGKVGKVSLAIYGNKRDVPPIYAASGLKHSASADFFDYHGMDGVKNSLRYYGKTMDSGILLNYDVNAHNKMNVEIKKYSENMDKYSKHSDSPLEPVQHFKRSVERNKYHWDWQGNDGKNLSWKASVTSSRMKEADVVLTSEYANSVQEGKNILNYVDNVDHRQSSAKVSIEKQVNDKHLVSLHAGFIYEQGTGSRLKNAPHVYVRKIDPWEYDKSLKIDEKNGQPVSTIHNYKWKNGKNGTLVWDYNYEQYGYDEKNPHTVLPKFTYEDYLENSAENGDLDYDKVFADPDILQKYMDFGTQLAGDSKNKNNDIENHDLVLQGGGAAYYYKDKNVYFNGKTFEEEFKNRINKQIEGEASIRKQYIVLSDMYKMNKNTMITPIVRWDHHSIFGAYLTGNIGVTHYVKGNAHRRIKMNVGTGYTEPGLGELYYNWEMFGSSPLGYDYKKDKDGNPLDANGKVISWQDPELAKKIIGGGKARLGWYWLGNAKLKPEKSVNVSLALEGENNNTYAKMGVFYNHIRDYMTTYFTGGVMDFSPYINETTKRGQDKWLAAPDLIYSFKNIGCADISGMELEWGHTFANHWQVKLGYTYLHAVNKSNPELPKQILDKPVHKMDIGLTYTDHKHGWSSSIWGNYYIHMLDSNSLAGGGNYVFSRPDPFHPDKSIIEYAFQNTKAITYKQKTFGLWHWLLQKRWNKDVSAYIGVDNVFNYRDDDRALPERTYRLGINLKWGDAPVSASYSTKESVRSEKVAFRKEKRRVAENEHRKTGIDFYGKYTMRYNWQSGLPRVQPTVMKNNIVTDAASVLCGEGKQIWEQQFSIGMKANWNNRLFLTVVGSAGADGNQRTESTKGLQPSRLDTVDLTDHSGRWDVSLGRLHEPLGITGYWFGKTYDGVRLAYADKKTRIHVGGGDFSAYTGVDRSPYTRLTYGEFLRVPTASEFIGYELNDKSNFDLSKEHIVPNAGPNVNFVQQLNHTKSLREKYAIMRRLVKIMKTSYGNSHMMYNTLIESPVQIGEDIPYWFKNSKGQEASMGSCAKVYKVLDDIAEKTLAWDDPRLLEGDGTAFGLQFWDMHKDEVIKRAEDTLKQDIINQGGTVIGWKTGNIKQKYRDVIKNTTYVWPNSIGNATFENIQWTFSHLDQGTLLPRQALEKAIGRCIKDQGINLHIDRIAPVNKAAFVQVTRSLTPALDVSAWYFHSLHDKNKVYYSLNGTTNEATVLGTMANVTAIGMKYRWENNAVISAEYGRNNTQFARYLHSNMRYEHPYGSSTFTYKGKESGSVPAFWILRLDIGKADPNMPHSWNAFLDYKHMEHGAFFGGNGTEVLPDTYLDGVKSFTIGGSYVSQSHILWQGSYTFNAQGTQPRYTLMGPENFKLGDYARIQATYFF